MNLAELEERAMSAYSSSLISVEAYELLSLIQIARSIRMAAEQTEGNAKLLLINAAFNEASQWEGVK